MKKFIMLMLIVTGLLSTAYAAETPSTMTINLDKAMDMSLSQSPGVIKAQGVADAAKNQVFVVATDDNPTLGLQLSATPWSNTNGNPVNNSLYSNSLTASYPLFTGFYNSSRISAAQASYQSSVYDLHNAVRLAKAKTAEDYLNCLMCKDDVEANRENVRNLQAHDEYVRAQYAVGKVSKLTLLQSVNTLSAARLKLIQAENEYSNAMTLLKIQIGVADTVQITLAETRKDEQPVPDKQSAISNYQATRPDVRSASVALEKDEYSLRTAYSGWWPSISVNASAGTSDSDIVLINNNKYNWSVGGTLNYALSDGGATRAAVKGAQIALENDKKSLEIIKAQAMADIKQSYDNLRDVKQALDVAKTGLAYAQEGYDIAKESFELGKSDNLTYFDSQQKLLNARTDYNKAYYKTITAHFALLAAIGEEK